MWSLLGIAVVAGFIGAHLEWRHGQVASGAASSASAISALGSAAPSAQFTLGFAGGISADSTIAQSVTTNFKGDYSQLFSSADFLKTPDISFATLQGTASAKGTDTKVPGSIRMSPGIIPALKAGGIDVVSLSSAHAFDWGRPALEDTISSIRKNGMLACGAGLTKTEAAAPSIIQENGQRIGYLCFLDGGTADMAATDATSGMLLASDPAFDSIVSSASRSVNALVVSFSWNAGGQTPQAAPTPEQIALADKAISDGAAMVVGTAPGMTEEVDEYQGKPIAYGLGDLISDQTASAPFAGLFVTAKLVGRGITGGTTNVVGLDANFQPSLVPPTAGSAQ